MRWEQPDARRGRAAVVLLIAAIFVATALAILLVIGAAGHSEGVILRGVDVTRDTEGVRATPRPVPGR